MQPPRFRRTGLAPPPARGWGSTKGSRQSRGYGRAHDKMRKRVLAEEPLCRSCAETGRVTPTVIADHIRPKAEGGSDDRSNYQGLCRACHAVKTAAEAAGGRQRERLD